MAVPEQTPYIEHTGNGVTTSFSLGFQCESKDHLIVLVDEIEPPIETWSLIDGNVVFTAAPTSGQKITLQRNTPFERTTDYQSYNNSFRPQAVNSDFDRVWWKIQELGVRDWLLDLKIQKFRDDVNLTAMEETLEQAQSLRDDTAAFAVDVKDNVVQSQTLLANTTAQANAAAISATSANSSKDLAKQYVDNIDGFLTAITGGHKAYPTLESALSDTSTFPINSIIEITLDGANNGAYYWDGADLTKSAYDPLTQAKAYTDAIKLLLDSDVSKNRESITRLLVSMQALVVALNTESTDLNSKINAVKTDINNIFASNLQLSNTLAQHLTAIQILVKAIESQSDEIQKAKDSVKDQIVTTHLLVQRLNGENGSSPGSGIGLTRGVFKYGDAYLKDQVFTHASGTYIALENVINAQTTPDQDSRYACIAESDGALKVAELSVKSTSITTGHPSSEVPHTISPDGMKMWGTYSMGKLLESSDFGKTWNQVHDFGDIHRVVWVRQTDNGELLLRTETYVYEEGNLVDIRQRVRRSVGYGTETMTFETCIDIQNRRNVLFHNGWSISTHKNIILIAEYGAKGDEPWGGQTLPAELSSRYAYMSLDYGVTWTTIFDTFDHIADTNGVHLHGICYDPYWERIWVNCGDRVAGLWYSDDLGATWTESEYFERIGDVTPEGKRQNVGIIALPTCVLFGTDYAQDGVHRIDRAHGKHIAGGKYPVDVAHAIKFGQGHTRAQVCHIINHTYQKENAPIIFGFCSETPVAGTAPAGTVVVTYDGWNFKQIWQDALWQPTGKGLQSLAGITLLNEIIIKSADSRSPTANTYTKITLKV